MKWEWILKETKRIAKTFKMKKMDEDDFVSDVICALLEDKKKSDQIYNEQNAALLCIYMKDIKIKTYAENEYGNYLRYYRYKQIKRVCESYGIELEEKNAWQIEYILNDRKNFSIGIIIETMRSKKPSPNSFISLDELSDKSRIVAYGE